MKPESRLAAVVLALVLTIPAQAGLEDKLASSNRTKREAALLKIHKLDLDEKVELLPALVEKYNSQTDSDERTDMNKAIVYISTSILSDAEDKVPYQTLVDACNAVGALGQAGAPAVPTLLQEMLYMGHQKGVIAAAWMQDDGMTHEGVNVAAENAVVNIGTAAVPAILQRLDQMYPDLMKGAPDLSIEKPKNVYAIGYWTMLSKFQTAEAQEAYKRFSESLIAKNKAQLAADQKRKDAKARGERSDFTVCLASAMAGNAAAQNDLGAMYYLGRGITKDDQQAFNWFSKAFAQGDPLAEGNLYALLTDEIKSKLLAQDVKAGKQPLNFMMPLPDVMGKLYYRQKPLWVFVDAGWEFSSAYTKREYVLKLLAIVHRYPLGIDAITIRRWDTEDNRVRELTYTEAPWTKVIFGDTLQTMTAESIAPNLPPGLAPVTPQEGRLER